MSLFKKPKKNIRRRVVGSIDEDDIEDNEVKNVSEEESRPRLALAVGLGLGVDPISGSQTMQTKLKDKIKVKKKQPLLSFEEDFNEGDDGEIFQVKKSSHSKKIMKLLDKERKKKKDVKKDDEKKDPVENNIKIEPQEITLVLKESKPAVLNGRAAEMAGVDALSSDEEERHPKFSRPDNVKLLLERGHIPDAAMIHAARKRRQMARDMGGDYIPVNNARNNDSNSKSRLVREEDGSEDDEERIEMEVNKAVRDRERRRETFMAAQDQAMEGDGKGEDDEWEAQQIRKGVTGAQFAAVQQEVLYGMYPSPVHIMAAAPIEEMNSERKMEVVTPEAVANKLRERLSSLQQIHRQHQLNRDGIVEDLVLTNNERDSLESEGPVLAEKFRFYQELRGYVTDLVECLDEKVSVIDSLEQRLLVLLRRRADDMMERRRQDVRDQADELAPISRTMAAARRSREEDEVRTRRAAEREGRRTRRRRAREMKGGGQRHQDGMSSDDEQTELDVTAFRNQMQQIESDARLVFSDVVDDFCSVRELMKRFERWRKEDSCAYREAYVSLCLPKVLGPIVRLKLMSWSPLEDAADFERSDWYDALVQYGLGGSESEAELRLDPDLLLIPKVVEKILLPKILQIVEAQWDPISTSQSLRLVGLLNRLMVDYPSLVPTSQPLSQLFIAIINKMRVAVEQDVFIPIFPRQTEPGRSQGMTVFFERQFGIAVKLLRNFLAWQGLISDIVLQEVALSGLLNRYLLTAIRNCEPNDGAAKCSMIATTFPRWWFQQTSTIPQLQMFVTHLRQIIKSLDTTLPSGKETSERLKQVANSLQGAVT